MISLALHGLVLMPWWLLGTLLLAQKPTALVRRISWKKLKGQIRKIGLVLCPCHTILPDLEQELGPAPPGFSSSYWAVVSVICALLPQAGL